jgi:glycosyltransferase involved in cell wall biosynthesis
VGEVGHADKVELLMGARALIFPIDWEEPFGLVVIEAMACGTPVIATRRGAVPEIVDHGRTGVIVDNYREMEDEAVLELADSLDPAVLRREVEERFSPEHMVANYVAAYEATIAAKSA